MKTKKKARVFDKRKEEEEENERYYENLDAFIRFFFFCAQGSFCLPEPVLLITIGVCEY
jgi:hypothetical protein